MLKKPLIVGNRGNMGRRYTAIFRHLGIEPLGVEQGEKVPQGFDSILIATPTASHIRDIEYAVKSGVPVLCEKPFATSAAAVEELLKRVGDYPLRMVNQYAFLDKPEASGPSRYDYWNHGGDGLAWDCINILGMARSEVSLGETSPIWDCWLNGQKLNIAEMDRVYVSMLGTWMLYEHKESNATYIRQAHRKVEEYLACKSSS